MILKVSRNAMMSGTKLGVIALFSLHAPHFVLAQTTSASVKASANDKKDEPREIYFNDRTGYGKRPRVGLEAEGYVSPSQLHEVWGQHVGVAAQFSNASVDQGPSNVDFKAQATQVDLRGMHGGSSYSVGLGLSYHDLQVNPQGPNPMDIDRKVMSVAPQGSYRLGRNFTVGVLAKVFAENYALRPNVTVGGVALNESNLDNDRDVNLVYGTVTGGLSYHDESKEAGVAYTSEAKANEKVNNTDEEINIYRAPVATLFARGNLTRSFSIFGTASYVMYERAATGTEGLAVYDRYDLRDRIAGKLGGVFWTTDRSSFTLAASYAGGTYFDGMGGADPIGYYGLVNRYGFDADLSIRLTKDTAVGVLGGLHRGERSDTINQVRYSVKEERSRIGTTINVVL